MRCPNVGKMKAKMIVTLLALLPAVVLSEESKKTPQKRGAPYYIRKGRGMSFGDVSVQYIPGIELRTIPTLNTYQGKNLQSPFAGYFPSLDVEDIYAGNFPYLEKLLPPPPDAPQYYGNTINGNVNYQTIFMGKYRYPGQRDSTPVIEDDILDIPPPPPPRPSPSQLSYPLAPPFAAFSSQNPTQTLQIGSGSLGYTPLGNGAVAIGSGSLGRTIPDGAPIVSRLRPQSAPLTNQNFQNLQNNQNFQNLQNNQNFQNLQYNQYFQNLQSNQNLQNNQNYQNNNQNFQNYQNTQNFQNNQNFQNSQPFYGAYGSQGSQRIQSSRNMYNYANGQFGNQIYPSNYF